VGAAHVTVGAAHVTVGAAHVTVEAGCVTVGAGCPSTGRSADIGAHGDHSTQSAVPRKGGEGARRATSRRGSGPPEPFGRRQELCGTGARAHGHPGQARGHPGLLWGVDCAWLTMWGRVGRGQLTSARDASAAPGPGDGHAWGGGGRGRREAGSVVWQSQSAGRPRVLSFMALVVTIRITPLTSHTWSEPIENTSRRGAKAHATAVKTTMVKSAACGRLMALCIYMLRPS